LAKKVIPAPFAVPPVLVNVAKVFAPFIVGTAVLLLVIVRVP
jgi:hypothetical protein